MTEDCEPEKWPDKDFQTVKIRMDPFGKGRIWIDDMELTYTYSVEFTADNNKPNVITIKLLGNIDLDARIANDNIKTMKALHSAN